MYAVRSFRSENFTQSTDVPSRLATGKEENFLFLSFSISLDCTEVIITFGEIIPSQIFDCSTLVNLMITFPLNKLKCIRLLLSMKTYGANKNADRSSQHRTHTACVRSIKNAERRLISEA